jgi:hypothetical protein
MVMVESVVKQLNTMKLQVAKLAERVKAEQHNAGIGVKAILTLNAVHVMQYIPFNVFDLITLHFSCDISLGVGEYRFLGCSVSTLSMPLFIGMNLISKSSLFFTICSVVFGSDANFSNAVAILFTFSPCARLFCCLMSSLFASIIFIDYL